MQLNLLSSAKYYLETALNNGQRILINVATDRNVASTLHAIGRCNEINCLALSIIWKQQILNNELQSILLHMEMWFLLSTPLLMFI